MTNGVPIIAASTVAVPLATIPPREWASAGRASGTRWIEALSPMSDSKKVRSSVGATGSRYSYPGPNFATDSRIAGKFIRTSFIRLPGMRVIQGLVASRLVLAGISCAINFRAGKICQRMSDESGIHSAIAVKLFFKRKDHQGLVDVFPQQAHPSLTPCPELRTHVIDDRNAALVHLPCNSPVERRRVNHNGEIGFALVRFSDQLVEQALDFGQMTENFRNPDDRQVSGIDD